MVFFVKISLIKLRRMVGLLWRIEFRHFSSEIASACGTSQYADALTHIGSVNKCKKKSSIYTPMSVFLCFWRVSNSSEVSFTDFIHQYYPICDYGVSWRFRQTFIHVFIRQNLGLRHFLLVPKNDCRLLYISNRPYTAWPFGTGGRTILAIRRAIFFLFSSSKDMIFQMVEALCHIFYYHKSNNVRDFLYNE